MTPELAKATRDLAATMALRALVDATRDVPHLAIGADLRVRRFRVTRLSRTLYSVYDNLACKMTTGSLDAALTDLQYALTFDRLPSVRGGWA